MRMQSRSNWPALLATCSLAIAPIAPSRAAPAQNGEVIVAEDFAGASSLDRWSNNGDGSAGIDHGALSIRLFDPKTHLVSCHVPVERFRGTRLTLSAKVKALDVSRPEMGHDGIKFILQTRAPGGDRYHAVTDLHGAFDWRALGVSAPIPPDATEINILLGLAGVTGEVFFDDVKLVVSGVPRKRTEVNPNAETKEKPDRRTDVHRLRGVMYGPRVNEADLRVLAGWGANLIRWQFYWHGGSFEDQRRDLSAYDKWLEQTMADLERLLPVCKELGLRVVIDLHTPPGGTSAGHWLMFSEAVYQQKFIDTWDRLVNRFRNEPSIWGYDLLNEPFEGARGEGLMDWRTLAEFVARRVRAADPVKAIIVAPGPFGGWDNLPYFEPLDVPGIIYTIHMYEPLEFTHQGVFDGIKIGTNYPGKIDGVEWDKSRIREVLEPVRQYQRDYNVPVFVGEFSAPRWAPDGSAAAYLRDCIDVFEEFGWDWAYHSFREWHAWNVELVSDPTQELAASSPTDRQQVLMKGFQRDSKKAGSPGPP